MDFKKIIGGSAKVMSNNISMQEQIRDSAAESVKTEKRALFRVFPINVQYFFTKSN